MYMKKTLPKRHSELRQDLVSGDWILFAPGRLQYSHSLTFLKKKPKRVVAPIQTCPFEEPLKNVSEKIILSYEMPNTSSRADGAWKNWEILVLENKYPAVQYSPIKLFSLRGPFIAVSGVGHHDLVITREHNVPFMRLSPEKAFHVFEAFRDRYLMLFADKNIAYVSIFHNWGPFSGASVYHPHYQIIGVPVVPPDISHSLEGSDRYFKKHKTCVHCKMIAWELKQKKRVILKTKRAIAIAPFVSRNQFEVRIFPLKHLPYFENSFDEDLHGVVDVLQKVLRKMHKNLNDPDFNFFIHTAPVENKKKHTHYHWHIEIYPKMNVRAGFEYGTGIEINSVDPDLAAKILRK